MSKLQSIIEGWNNYIFPKQSVEKIAQYRAKECSDCNQAVKREWLEAVIGDKNLKSVSGYVCNICNCPLSAKTRSLKEKCPLEKW